MECRPNLARLSGTEKNSLPPFDFQSCARCKKPERTRARGVRFERCTQCQIGYCSRRCKVRDWNLYKRICSRAWFANDANPQGGLPPVPHNLLLSRIFRHLARNDFLHNVSKKDAFIQLIDSFRFRRVDISLKVNKDDVQLIERDGKQLIEENIQLIQDIQPIQQEETQLSEEQDFEEEDIEEEDIEEEDIEKVDNQLTDCARLHRVGINPKVRKDAEKDFATFLDLAESREGLLPPWWNATARSKCEALGNKQNGYSSIRKILGEADIRKHYDDMIMPFQLRALRQLVYDK